MAERILIIGCPGSGKSTLARTLEELTGLPLIHLDLLYWNADRTTVPKELFLQRLDEALKKDRWIIDGNYLSTMELRLSHCDRVIFLDLPTQVCLDGIRSRMGKERPDMPWIETEEDPEFLSFIRNFQEKSRPVILSLLEQSPNVEQVILSSREEAERYLASLKQEKL